MKAIILARVSTEEQKDAGNSLPAQINRIEDYCKRNSFDVVRVFSFDESAYGNKRDEFDKALEYLKQTKEKIAICFDKVDRLSRNIFDKRIPLLHEKAMAGKIELHFVSDGQVINSEMCATENFRFNINLGLARYYSDATADNVKRAFEQKRRNGEWTGPVHFGYKAIHIDKNKRLRRDIVPDPEKENIIIELFEKYASGNYSCKQLADDIEKRKIKTKKGKPLYPSVIHNILKNTFYYGVAYSRKYNKYYDHKYKPLISKNLFLRVQKELEKRNNNPTKKNNRKKFIFSGLLKCARCGCSLSPENPKGDNIYYSCTNAKKICKRLYVKEEDLLSPVMRFLRQIKLDDEQINNLVTHLKKNHENQALHHKKKIREVNQKYEEAQQMIDRLLDLLLKGSITQEDYNRKLKKLKEEQYGLGVQKEELTQADESYHITIKTVLNIAKKAEKIFESSEIEEKNEFLKFLLQNRIVDGKNPLFEMKEPFLSISKASNHPTLLRG